MRRRLRAAAPVLAMSLGLAIAIALPSRACAQGYSIHWSTLDGGGAMRSAGGTFSVGGTVGQPDAGLLTGGSFSLEGGFWGIPIPRLLDVMAPDAALEPDVLAMALPNPFRASTEVDFALTREGQARLAVFDLGGRRVRSLVQGTQSPGLYHVHWDGTSDDGQHLAAGVYFFRLDTETRHTTRRVVLLN